MAERDNPTAVKFVTVTRKIDDAIAMAEKGIIVFALSVMVLAIFAQTVLRGVADTGLGGASELSIFLMVYVGFIGASLATAQRKHIVIDVAAKALKGKPRVSAATVAFAYGVTTLFIGYLFFAGLEYYQSNAIQMADISGLNIPKRYNVIILPIALVTICLRSILITIEETMVALGMLDPSWERQPPGFDDFAEQDDSEAEEALLDAQRHDGGAA